MRNLLLLLVLAISTSLFSQMQIPTLSFVFEDKDTFTQQFLDKQNAKEFDLKVVGISNELDKQALVHMVKEMRGVEEFKVEPSDVDGEYNAKIKVYRYATGFWYWATFMEKVGVPKIKINNVIYTSETIKTLE